MATLGLGDIAFTGYQATSTDKISMVLLKSIDSGTVLTITDNAWSGLSLATNEGSSTIQFSGVFPAGTQVNYDASRGPGLKWTVGSSNTNITDMTGSGFALNASGDNLFAFNGQVVPASGNSSNWIAALATNPFLTTGASSSSLTYLPSIFHSTNASISLGIANGSSNENGAYTGGNIAGSANEIRQVVHLPSNWTTFTSAGGQSIPPSATFTLLASTNQPPTNLALSNATILEGSGPNAIVGNFSTFDPDIGDTFSYTLVIGLGSMDNSSFNLAGNTLRATGDFDYETKSSYSIRVRTTDQGGLFFEAAFTIQVIPTATANLRIVSYNIASSESPGSPRTGLSTILEAIGNEVVDGLSRPIDLLAVQEVFSQTTTTASVANMLNAIYSVSDYAYGFLNGSSNGSGTQGVVYNTRTLTLLSESAVGVVNFNGQPRQTLRYHFQPVRAGGSSDFYLYNSHWKAVDDQDGRDKRLIEAEAIRANADALGNGKNIIYAGDFNVYSGSELAFQEMIGAGNGQALDPINRIGSWNNNPSFVGVFTQAPAATAPVGLVGGGLDDRFDFQLVSSELMDGVGIDYRSSSYRAFGNNGSVPLNGSINSPSNTALQGLSNRTTVLNLLATVSDHLPVVADYRLPVPAPVVAPRIDTLVFGDGTAQRSMVTSIQVNFDSEVVVDASAFALEVSSIDGGGAFAPVAFTVNQATSLVAGKTVATLTFSGTGIVAGSLPDGNYRLTALSSNIRSSIGSIALDGDNNGVAGGNFVDGESATDNFFRLFGDSDGNGIMNPLETNRYRATVGKSLGDLGFNGLFDFDGNNSITPADTNQFRQRVGKTRVF